MYFVKSIEMFADTVCMLWRMFDNILKLVLLTQYEEGAREAGE